jgi:hypothetical protein
MGGQVHWQINRESGQAVFEGGGNVVFLIGAGRIATALVDIFLPRNSAGAHSHKKGTHSNVGDDCEDDSVTIDNVPRPRTPSIGRSFGIL